MNELTIRPATSDDRAGLLDLFRRCLDDGTVPSSSRFWRWKHECNPFGASYCLVAEASGHIVGMRPLLRWEWSYGRQRLAAVRAVDTATDPAWRRSGLFNRLTRGALEQLRRDGVAFVFNTPNRFSRPGYLKMGWRNVGRPPLLWRPLRPLALFRGGSPEDGPAELFNSLPAVGELLALPELPHLLEAETHRHDERYSTFRSAGYLKWRYADIPEVRYRTHWIVDERAGAAVILRRRHRRRRQELTICDLLIGPSARSEQMAVDLLSELARNRAFDYILASAAPRTVDRRVLGQAGFLPLPLVGPRLAVRPILPPERAPDPLARRSWRLSIGDLELL